MKIRFYNSRIATMENNQIINGELHVVDNKISYIGNTKTNDDIKWDRQIDCKNNLLLPGFKNAHTHSGMTLMRSYADGLPLAEWLNTKIFPLEAKMTGEDVAILSKLSILEYLTSGITAVFDMYLTPETIAPAFSEAGMRLVQVSGINKFGPTLEVLEERYNKLNNVDPLTSFMLGFHAEYTCERSLLESVSELAHKYKAPIYAHNSETESEVKECIDRYGLTPTELMEELNMFDFGGGGYHCVYMSEHDIEIFKNRNLSIVTNPGSNTKLASGIAPIKRFIKEGINVAIGTDGPSSNNCLDMFKEMSLVYSLSNIREKDPLAIDGIEILKMATVGGAKAMGLNDSDVLAVGKNADLIMIDMHQPNMQPENDILRNLVYSGSKQNVKMTMINGKILYEDGVYNIGMDPEDIYKEANSILKRIG